MSKGAWRVLVVIMVAGTEVLGLATWSGCGIEVASDGISPNRF